MTSERQLLTYPVIMHESNDEDGHYFTVTSPNIPGMVTEGDTREEATEEAIDAIATMLDGESYPAVQDPAGWHLEPAESIAYITVDMAKWREEKKQTGHEDSTILASIAEYKAADRGEKARIIEHVVKVDMPDDKQNQSNDSALTKDMTEALDDAKHPERLHHYDSVEDMLRELNI